MVGPLCWILLRPLWLLCFHSITSPNRLLRGNIIITVITLWRPMGGIHIVDISLSKYFNESRSPFGKFWLFNFSTGALKTHSSIWAQIGINYENMALFCVESKASYPVKYSLYICPHLFMTRKISHQRQNFHVWTECNKSRSLPMCS